MPGWLIVEDTKTGIVEVLNINCLQGFIASAKKHGKISVAVDTVRIPEFTGFTLENWSEFERLINTLPAIDNYGWILVRDGVVKQWRGRLAVKEVKELTEEEENAVLEESEVQETGCWDEDAGEFRIPCP